MGGPYAIFWGSVCHIFCRNPLILTDFYAIQTPIAWHILGAYFLQIWGVGVVRIIFNKGCLCRATGIANHWRLEGLGAAILNFEDMNLFVQQCRGDSLRSRPWSPRTAHFWLSRGIGARGFKQKFWRISSSNLFEGLIFLLACSVHFVRRRFWAISTEFHREVARIVGGQHVQSMRVKRSDPQKDQNFIFSWKMTRNSGAVSQALGQSLRFSGFCGARKGSVGGDQLLHQVEMQTKWDSKPPVIRNGACGQKQNPSTLERSCWQFWCVLFLFWLAPLVFAILQRQECKSIIVPSAASAGASIAPCRTRDCLSGMTSIRNFLVTPTPRTFSKVLPYKWEAYCRTNRRHTAVQMGGVLLGFPFFKV